MMRKRLRPCSTAGQESSETPCTHPAFLRDMCVSCGCHISKRQRTADETTSPNASASGSGEAQGGGENIIICAGHTIKMSNAEASAIQGMQSRGLTLNKKLALILDLDNTLIHAHPIRNSLLPHLKLPETMFQIDMKSGSKSHYHLIQKRNNLDEFLKEISNLFQLFVYTHGLRNYAEAIVQELDPTGTYFGSRIISWSDIPGVKDERERAHGKKSLKNFFLDDWSMVLVLDDREDVWQIENQHKHLWQVKPFLYHGFDDLVNTAAEKIKIQQQDVINSDMILCAAPPLDEDRQLHRCLEVLRTVHSKFYDSHQDIVQKSVGIILCEIKKEILKGCRICFSRMFPTNMQKTDMENHVIWRKAKELGAIVQHEVDEYLTHLVTTTSDTNKSKKCLSLQSVFIVHPDWLLQSYWHIRRESEVVFSLAPLPTIKPFEPLGADTINVATVLEEQKEDLTIDHENITTTSSGENANESDITCSSDSDSDSEWDRFEDEIAAVLR